MTIAVSFGGARQRAVDTYAPARPGFHRSSIVPLQLIRAGKILFCDGDVGDHVYQVVSGTIRFFTVLLDGRRLVAGFAVAGEFFSLSHGGRHVFSSEAVSDCSYRVFSRSNVLGSIGEEFGLHSQIANRLQNEPWVMQSETLRLLHKSADEAIAYFIYNIGRRLNPNLCDGALVRIDMSRADIADFLGLTVETVCRGIKRLVKEGMVGGKGPHEFVIRDMRALRLLAGGASTD